MRQSVILLVTALAMPAIAGAQERDRDFRFSERVPSGAWLRVHSTHGDIRVTAASGDQVEVIGRKSGDDAADLRITTLRNGDDVTILCLLRGLAVRRRGRSLLPEVEPRWRGKRRLRGAFAEGREDSGAVRQR